MQQLTLQYIFVTLGIYPILTLFWMELGCSSFLRLRRCPEKHHSRWLPKNNPCCFAVIHRRIYYCNSRWLLSFFRPSSSTTQPIFAVAFLRKALEKCFPFSFSGHHHYDEALQNYSCCFSWMIGTCKDSGNCLRTTRWGQNTVWAIHNMSGE